MIYKIDIKRISDGKIHIQGWVLPKNPSSSVKFKLLDSSGNKVNINVVRLKRDDVAEVHLDNYIGDKNFGFEIEFDYVDGDMSNYYLHIITEEKESIEKISKEIVDKFNTKDRKR